MADTKISALGSASTPAGTETLAIVQSGTTVKATLNQASGVTETRAKQSVRLEKTSTQTLSTATWTALTWASERYDNGGQHSTSSNTDRITCTVAGPWRFSGTVQFAANATGIRGLRLRLNGGATIIGQVYMNAVSGATSNVPISSAWTMNGTTDYITVEAYQSSGGNLDVSTGAQCHLVAELTHRS